MKVSKERIPSSSRKSDYLEDEEEISYSEGWYLCNYVHGVSFRKIEIFTSSSAQTYNIALYWLYKCNNDILMPLNIKQVLHKS